MTSDHAGHAVHVQGLIKQYAVHEKEPGFMQDVRARYGKGTSPDPAAALPLTDLLSHLTATQETLAAALATADLTPTVQSPFGPMVLGDFIDFFGWHEGYHAGQAILLHHQLTGQ